MNKSDRVYVRVTPTLKKRLEKARKASGAESLADFVREACLIHLGTIENQFNNK